MRTYVLTRASPGSFTLQNKEERSILVVSVVTSTLHTTGRAWSLLGRVRSSSLLRTGRRREGIGLGMGELSLPRSRGMRLLSLMCTLAGIGNVSHPLSIGDVLDGALVMEIDSTMFEKGENESPLQGTETRMACVTLVVLGERMGLGLRLETILGMSRSVAVRRREEVTLLIAETISGS